jgi:hypothetical protein
MIRLMHFMHRFTCRTASLRIESAASGLMIPRKMLN